MPAKRKRNVKDISPTRLGLGSLAAVAAGIVLIPVGSGIESHYHMRAAFDCSFGGGSSCAGNDTLYTLGSYLHTAGWIALVLGIIGVIIAGLEFLDTYIKAKKAGTEPQMPRAMAVAAERIVALGSSLRSSTSQAGVTNTPGTAGYSSPASPSPTTAPGSPPTLEPGIDTPGNSR